MKCNLFILDLAELMIWHIGIQLLDLECMTIAYLLYIPLIYIVLGVEGHLDSGHLNTDI